MKRFDLTPNSTCWIYQSNRALDATEIVWIEEKLEEFVGQWAAHGAKLTSQGMVVGKYHVVIAVDQSVAGASGCSIDASVRFVKSIGNELDINFFDRLKLLVENDNVSPRLIPFSEIKQYPNDFVYNNLVNTVSDFETKWKVKVSESPFYN